MTLGRRRFVHCSLCASATSMMLAGCDSDGPMGGDDGPGPSPDIGVAPNECDSIFDGGTFEGVVPFVNEDLPLNRLLGSGLDGRLYTDLSVLAEGGDLLINNDDFYIRTTEPDTLFLSDAQREAALDSWEISVGGLARETTISLRDQILPNVRDMGVHVLECSGNGQRAGFGLMSAARWAGVPVMDILDQLEPMAGATQVLFRGNDDHSMDSLGNSRRGAEWIFSFEQLAEYGAFLATEMNGVPLPPNHGFPVRLYVPGWYGCTCVKWLEAIEFVDDDAEPTSQMVEFTGRTEQIGQPGLARNFLPAAMDQAAMPVRVERWTVDGETVYRVIGVLWGGREPIQNLLFATDAGDGEPVDVCPAQTQNALWTLWQHAWRPTARRTYRLFLEVEDSIQTRRLDRGFYGRDIRIDVT